MAKSLFQVEHYNIEPGTEKGPPIHNALIIVKPLRRGVAIMSK